MYSTCRRELIKLASGMLDIDTSHEDANILTYRGLDV